MSVPTVVVVGAGPAGLTAATELARSVDVVVLEREQVAGGIPRHSDHPGYGMRDLHRFMTGPSYARHLVRAAQRAGAEIRTRAMVTGWSADGRLEVTSPQGRQLVAADAVILATGARERPRTARLVPGDRPAGVYTTGQLQNVVHLHHRVPGSRAVVVGAELVSWSAVVTLREAGCRTVLMTTRHRRPESYAAFNLVGRLALRAPVATRTRVIKVIGKRRVEGVEVEDIVTGARRVVECDTVVFTGDWIPDNELASAAGIEMDRGTKGPLVDSALRTSRRRTFAAGNLVHPVETADIAALGGRHAAASVLADLGGHHGSDDHVRVRALEPFLWVSPGLLRARDRPLARSRLVLWTNHLVPRPHVVVWQDGREIGTVTGPWVASPGRAFHVPDRALRHVDFRGGDVTIGLRPQT